MPDNDFKVDMVYLWCDGNEAAFKKRKDEWLQQEKYYDEYFMGEQRFFDNDELKYSLRSLEQYAPWINHVFIVTDRQIPKWLATNDKRVSIIDHAQIMPNSNIPCFNADVIERYIAFIPELQEHFIYGNDDTFFGRPVNRSFFFDQGQPIMRLKRQFTAEEKYTLKEVTAIVKKKNAPWKQLLNSWRLLMERNNLEEVTVLNRWHNIDAYTKSEYQKVFAKYYDVLNKNTPKFRTENDVERIVFSMEPVLSGRAKLKMVHTLTRGQKIKSMLSGKSIEGYYATERLKSLLAIKFLHPKVFCINDEGIGTARTKKRMRDFLKGMFPQKSSFEK